jgi:hypothetical protein
VRFDIGMIKAENRAAAKAYQREILQRWRDEAHAQAVAVDLEELRRLRHYLIFNAKVRIPHMALTEAIDVELLSSTRRIIPLAGDDLRQRKMKEPCRVGVSRVG